MCGVRHLFASEAICTNGLVLGVRKAFYHSKAVVFNLGVATPLGSRELHSSLLFQFIFRTWNVFVKKS